jgi:hypothetical protein
VVVHDVNAFGIRDPLDFTAHSQRVHHFRIGLAEPRRDGAIPQRHESRGGTRFTGAEQGYVVSAPDQRVRQISDYGLDAAVALWRDIEIRWRDERDPQRDHTIGSDDQISAAHAIPSFASLASALALLPDECQLLRGTGALANRRAPAG